MISFLLDTVSAASVLNKQQQQQIPHVTKPTDTYQLMMTVLLLTCSTLILSILWPLRAKSCRQIQQCQGLNLPLLGHTFTLAPQIPRLGEWLREQNAKAQGRTWCFATPTQPLCICISSEANLEHVLKTNFANYQKGADFTSRMHDLLGHGIFNVDGDEWRLQRKIASQIFTTRALKHSMSPVFVDHAKLAMLRVESACKSKSEIDLYSLFSSYALDSIGLIAFGVDLHTLTNTETHPMLRAFDRAQHIIETRFLTLGYTVMRALNLGAERELKQHMRVLHSFAQEVVDSRLALSEEKLSSRTDLLSTFVTTGRASGVEFSPEYIRDIILNFMLAGRDSTAQALSWCIYELCLHPEWQSKVALECKQVFPEGTEVSYEGCSAASLPITQAVMQETLRLHPSVPREMKTCLADDVLPDGTLVKAGDDVMPLLQCMAHATSIWGKDAAEFNPQRFLSEANGKTECADPSPFKLCAFQAGPRTCLGKQMAYLEAKVMLAHLLPRFTIQLAKDCVVEAETALTLPMRHPFRCNITARA